MSKYKLSPSKAHRYLQCTASLQYDTEFVETPASIRGSLLHDLAVKMFQNEEDVDDIISENQINDYEYNLIRAYIETLHAERSLIKGKEIILEQKETVNLYGNSINMIIDALIVAGHRATIIDLKTGRVGVDVDENEQLLFYALYVFQKYPKVKEVKTIIFQNFKMKSIKLTKNEVLDFFIDKQDIFVEIATDDLQYNPSEKACQWCAFKNKCLARAKWIANIK